MDTLTNLISLLIPLTQHHSIMSTDAFSIDPLVQECIDGNERMADAVVTSSAIMIGITLLLLPVLVYLTNKVCRKVWRNEKAVPLMMVALCVTLLMLVFYFSFLIRSVQHPRWCCDEESSCNCAASFFAELPAFCLANAVILNLNVWVYFNLRINAFIKVGLGMNGNLKKRKDSVNTETYDSIISGTEGKKIDQFVDTESDISGGSAVIDLFEQENQKLNRRVKVSNAICIGLAVCYSLVSLFFILQPCWGGDPEKFDPATRLTTSIIFCVLGTAFFFTGLTMNLSLRRYFPHFYNSFWCFLWIACLFLTIPLFLRTIINLSKNLSPDFLEWFKDEDHFATTNTLYLVCSTYIPIITQMSSLVFGFLRKRQAAVV